MRNKYRILWGIAVLCVITVAPLSAQENEASSSYVNDLLNNQYLVENQRLVGLAEKSLTDGKYDDAVKYAKQADEFAEQSDKYVALQLKIKEANDAVDAAQARMDWAKKAGIDKRYAETYTAGDAALTEAVGFRSGEKWDEARVSALKVISIMGELPEEIPLPAQYVVRAWAQEKDCLWNIAAKPEVYGDPAQWRRLYTANRQKMPKPDDPNLLEPGMVLDIPSIGGEFRFGVLAGD
jgi:nucleoid-associated protein YgaU